MPHSLGLPGAREALAQIGIPIWGIPDSAACANSPQPIVGDPSGTLPWESFFTHKDPMVRVTLFRLPISLLLLLLLAVAAPTTTVTVNVAHRKPSTTLDLQPARDLLAQEPPLPFPFSSPPTILPCREILAGSSNSGNSPG